MVDRPRGVLAGRRGCGWWVEVVARIVRIRVPVPPALPSVICVFLSIVELEIVVRVPAN
jgi:hypothetical protein